MSALDLCSYIQASPSPYHCVAETARRLDEAGYTELDERSDWGTLREGDRVYVRRDGTIAAFLIGGASPAEAGFRLVGAHTDSPNLRLKPRGETTTEGYRMWAVEVYGGVLRHTWTDRDLGLCGRVAVRGPSGVELRMIRVDRPIARIANLAIHLNREVNEGLTLNPQTHLPALVGLAGERPGALDRLLEAELGVERADVLGWDLMLFDVVPPTLGGFDEEFVFAPRLDNQGSCFTALQALLSLDAPGEATAGIVLFDHEECGSQSAHGADGGFFANALRRIERGHDRQVPGGLERAAAHSLLVSADMAHGVHPNYADKHEPNHKPRLNGGPVIKSNVNNRYATNGETAAIFRRACAEVEVPVQDFITRTDLACGTTIGPISASQLAIRTVDVGNAMLSMHSIREQTGAADVARMSAVKAQILRG